MKVAIFEDERPALDHLRAALLRCRPDAEVVFESATVRDAVAWLRANPAPDLILADIELADGRSLGLFEQIQVSCPVVFCTAYDHYVTEAFACNGIDYVLKPIDDDALGRALERYRKLEEHFGARVARVARALAAPVPSRRQRLIGRRGAALVAIAVAELAYAMVEDGVTMAVDRDGERFAVDQTLAELEAELDPGEFFRANRQVLVRASAVRSFRSHGKGRLLVRLDPGGPELVISQQNAARFRDWLDR